MRKVAEIPGKNIPQGGYSAFVPAPLPPKFDWTAKLIGALSDADRLVGRLAGEGGRLPNPHILIRPFVRREAVLSSKIEGTQATLGELLAAEAGAAVDRSPEDLREVGNYVVALEHGISRLKNLPLCVRFTRELHEKLMTGVKGTMPRQAVSEPFRTGLENPAARSLQRHTSHRLREKSNRALLPGKSFCTNQRFRLWLQLRSRIISSKPCIRFLTAMAESGVFLSPCF